MVIGHIKQEAFKTSACIERPKEKVLIDSEEPPIESFAKDFTPKAICDTIKSLAKDFTPTAICDTMG